MKRKTKPPTVIVMRSCPKSMTTRNGFVWPTAGPVRAPDFLPTKECGHGLHGLLSSQNDPGEWYQDGVILGVEVCAADLIDLGGKVKFEGGNVVYCGDMFGFCRQFSGTWYRASVTGGSGATVTGGEGATVTGGDGATVTGGYMATVTGGDMATVTGGGGATVTGGYMATVTGGEGAILCIKWHDGNRYRQAVAYVGEDGIKHKTKYRCKAGKLAEVP